MKRLINSEYWLAFYSIINHLNHNPGNINLSNLKFVSLIKIRSPKKLIKKTCKNKNFKMIIKKESKKVKKKLSKNKKR